MDKYSELLIHLENIGLNNLEAKIYLNLLSQGEMSAYQLAKKIEIARPSIYNALEHMVDKGIVEYVPEKTPLYIAKNPKLLLGKIKKNMEDSLTSAQSLLESYVQSRVDEQVIAMKGYDDVILKAKEMMQQAKNDIYVNADFDLDIFADEFEELSKRGINVIVFSFYDIDKGHELVKLYTHGRKMTKEHLSTRFMLVEYNTASLVAGRNSGFDEWTGMFSTIPINVRTIEEHIHNDIYMLKLRDLYGKSMYDKVYINSQFENSNRKK